MALDRPVCISLCIIYGVFGYIFGQMWSKFEPLPHVILSNEVFTTVDDCDTDTKCLVHCNTDRFCGFAQFNKESRVCRLKRKDTCANIEQAPQWNVYKRTKIDITQMVVLEGASFDLVNGVPNKPGENAVDGNLNTVSVVKSDLGSAWVMNFGRVWPISKLAITYERYYSQMLDVRVSGQVLARGACKGVPNRYGVKKCEFFSESLCWHDTSAINITSPSRNLAIVLLEVEIFS